MKKMETVLSLTDLISLRKMFDCDFLKEELGVQSKQLLPEYTVNIIMDMPY